MDHRICAQADFHQGSAVTRAFLLRTARKSALTLAAFLLMGSFVNVVYAQGGHIINASAWAGTGPYTITSITATMTIGVFNATPVVNTAVTVQFYNPCATKVKIGGPVAATTDATGKLNFGPAPPPASNVLIPAGAAPNGGCLIVTGPGAAPAPSTQIDWSRGWGTWLGLSTGVDPYGLPGTTSPQDWQLTGGSPSMQVTLASGTALPTLNVTGSNFNLNYSLVSSGLYDASIADANGYISLSDGSLVSFPEGIPFGTIQYSTDTSGTLDFLTSDIEGYQGTGLPASWVYDPSTNFTIGTITNNGSTYTFVSQVVTGDGTGGSGTVHFVGAGSSSQFAMSAIAADQAAINANASLYGGGNYIYHWTKKYNPSTGDGAYLSDNRNGSIANEYGNVWVVWIENYAGAVTDVWTDVSVDSSVGVRCALAQQANGSGCQVQIGSAAGAASDGLIAQNLWPDGNADVAIDQNSLNTINTTIAGGEHVNVALTDVRAEDALYATNRTLGTLNTTSWAGLGYALGQSGTSKLVGINILSAQPGSSAYVQPVSFALPGKKDPFNTSLTVPTTFVAYPVGAAPIVFITNNNGTEAIFNLVSGVTPDVHATGQTYPLAHLFDGSTSCDTSSVAFGGNGDGQGTPLTLFLQPPLSGAMNTAEFNLFRSYDNTDDSQEKGVNPANPNNNPLDLSCTGTGVRERAIGTGEVIGGSGKGGIIGTANSLGYLFAGWESLAKFGGSSLYNYLTLDGADPIFASPTAYSICVGGTSPGAVCGTNEPCAGGGVCTPGGNANQTVPNCESSVCSADLWPSYADPYTGFTYQANATYPNLRYGMYKAWSIYRWLAIPNNDPYGPSALAQQAQNYVDQQVADFVPFSACAAGETSCNTPTDGLGVFRSHFTPAGVTLDCGFGTTLSNGSVSTSNAFDDANTLGGGIECGGDVGGLVYGPFGTNSPSVSYVTIGTTVMHGKGYKVTYKNGDAISGLTDGTLVSVTCTNASGDEATTATSVEDNVSGTVYLSSSTPITGNNGTIACMLIDPNITHNPATSAQDGSSYHSKHQ
jgi:hypothetical protein